MKQKVDKQVASKKIKFKDVRRRLIRDRYLYMLLIPVLIYFILFKYVPMYGSIIAFKNYRISDGISGGDWVGLKNFIKLFSGADFYLVLRNTLLLNLYSIVFSFPMPILLALLLNEVTATGFKKSVQSILYIPHFISWVVLGGIVISIFSPKTGIINNVIAACGGEPIYFMRSSFWWPVVFTLSSIWQSAGWGTIVYMAAISGIDEQLYEAATIDGANRFKRIIHITLPGIRSTIAILLIMRMGYMLDIGFEHVYMLQNDAVRGVADVISTYEYRMGLQGMQYSYTTALGLFKGLIGLILVTATNKVTKSLGEEGLW